MKLIPSSLALVAVGWVACQTIPSLLAASHGLKAGRVYSGLDDALFSASSYKIRHGVLPSRDELPMPASYTLGSYTTAQGSSGSFIIDQEAQAPDAFDGIPRVRVEAGVQPVLIGRCEGNCTMAVDDSALGHVAE